MMARFPRLRGVGSMLLEAGSAWVSHNAASLGAALAFYTLFSIAPILVIAMSVAGFVFGQQVAETHVLDEIAGLIGNTGADAVRELLLSAHYSDKQGIAAAVGIVTLLIGATSVFGELQNALDHIWNTPKDEHAMVWWRFVRSRVLSIGLVLGVGFLLMVSLVASAALAGLEGFLSSVLSQWKAILPLFDLLFSFIMSTILFAMIYKYVPRESIAWGDVWTGGAVTALLFTVGKTLIGIYLGKSSFNSAYGAAGSLVVLLLWIYYSAQIFLFGAEFTHVFAYTRGSRRPAVGPAAAPLARTPARLQPKASR